MAYRLLCLLCCLALLITVSACGRKTLPIPPEAAIPEAIKDLRCQQGENNLILTWTAPKQTAMGSELPRIEGFQLLRAVVPEEEYCSGCPVSFISLVELGADKAFVDPEKGVAQYIEMVLRPGYRYLYKVRTKAGWRLISQDSNTVSFAWDSPAQAPAIFKAVAGDRVVHLLWQPVSSLLNGAELTRQLSYQVYRDRGHDNFVPVGDPVLEPEYTDSGLINGREYSYKVRALHIRDDSRLLGLASRTASAIPRDMTAPFPPRNLEVIKAQNGIKILWERSMEKDLGGYNIYRRFSSESQMRAIGRVAAGKISFVDRGVPVGHGAVYFAVSAFDREDPPNESPLSQEIIYP